MKIVSIAKTVLFLAIALTAGCNNRNAPSPTESAPTAQPATNGNTATAAIDGWLGQWTGPEGTSLTLNKSEGGYRVTIQSLDGPASYEGTAAGDHIEFTRNGKTESIRATDGKGTGMKWLQDKTNCLTIQLSEGFCRD